MGGPVSAWHGEGPYAPTAITVQYYCITVLDRQGHSGLQVGRRPRTANGPPSLHSFHPRPFVAREPPTGNGAFGDGMGFALTLTAVE